MRSEILFSLAGCFALATLAGCADLKRGAPPSVDVAPPPPSVVDGGQPEARFSAVHPLLVNDCQSCHASDGVAGSSGLVLAGNIDTDLVQVLRFIDESTPASSRLLTKAAGVGHGGGATWPADSEEHALTLNWISQGALP